MQSTGTVWTTLVGDHPGIIPVKFGQNPISSLEEMLFKETVDARTHWQWTTDNGPSQKLTLSTLCSGELKIQANIYMKDKNLKYNTSENETFWNFTVTYAWIT